MQVIKQEHQLHTGRTLIFMAQGVRKEKTGVHATVTIALDNERLAWSNFNVERDEDRVRLANSAHKALEGLEREVWTQDDMRRALSAFCAGLWGQHMGAVPTGAMAGGRRKEGPPFAIHPYVIEGGGTVLFGPPGRGKSFTGMLMAVSMDAGYDGLFGVKRPRKTMYVNIERSESSMADRLARINDCLGEPEERPLHFLNARGRSLADVADACERYVYEHEIEVGVLDSISRAGMGDLNENQAANRIIDSLNRIFPTWVALAHTPRSDDSHTYGSIHFDAGFDIGVKLSSQMRDKALGVALTITKANDTELGGKPMMYVLEFDHTGLVNLRQPKGGEFLELELAGGEKSAAVMVQQYLLSVGEASATQISDELGIERTNVSRILNTAPWTRRRRDGHSIMYSMIFREEQGSV